LNLKGGKTPAAFKRPEPRRGVARPRPVATQQIDELPPLLWIRARSKICGASAALVKACDGKPAAQLALRDTSRLFGVGVRQRIDPEFRLLSSVPGGKPERVTHEIVIRTVGRLADCWATEDPAVLMSRLATLSVEAGRGHHTLHPVIHVAFQALAERNVDLDRLVDAGLIAGLTWELNPLFRASIDRINAAPRWFSAALASPARATALGAALAPGPNRVAMEVALAELRPHDALIMERAIHLRSRIGHDWVSLGLLRHSIEEVRGTASLGFSVDGSDRAFALPAEWYSDWREAFIVAPLLAGRGQTNYQLGEHVTSLVARDPDVVEQWLTRKLALDPHTALYALPSQAQASLCGLPLAHRDRLLRRSDKGVRADLLSYLLGHDMAWLSRLLDDGVVEVADVPFGLDHSEGGVSDRITYILDLAPLLLPRGIAPEALARAAEFGGWMGERSANYEAIRAAFAATPANPDPLSEAVRLAGVEIFERGRDEALRAERDRRVVGDL
jgi:hypothetical protein